MIGVDFRDEKSTPRLGYQRWVGGHPVQQAGNGERLDFQNVYGIGEEFHLDPPHVGTVDGARSWPA